MTKLVKGILIAVVAVVAILALTIGIAVGIGIYGSRQAARHRNELAAARTLDTIAIAQIQYFTEHGTFGTFHELVENGFLTSEFRADAPIVHGYTYVLILTPARAGQKATFTLNAAPATASAGTRHFFMDDKSSSVRVNSNQPASVKDPPYLP